jgi:hypothetical protein
MMLTRASLTDPAICPVCGSPLAGPRCSTCGALLTSPEATLVWQLSQQIAGLLADRDAAIGQLRATAGRPTGPAVGPAAGSAAPQQAVPQWAAPVPAAPQPGPVAPPRPTWFARLGVHGLLLSVGALLLAVAAIAFLVYSWQLMGLPLRAAVIGVVTAAVLGAAGRMRPTVPDAAEAIGWLGVVLVLADAWAVRSTGLIGADQVPSAAYAAGAAAVSALVLAGWAALSGVRAGSISASALGPAALTLAGVQAGPPALAGQGLALGLLAACALTLLRAHLSLALMAERQLLRVVAGGALGLAVLVSISVPAAGDGPYGWAAVVLAMAGLLALAQAGADQNPDQGPDQTAVPARAWSLTAGAVLAVAAAEAGQAIARRFTVVPGAWIDADGTAAAGLSPWALLPMLGAALVVVTAKAPAIRRLGRAYTAADPAQLLAGSAAVAAVLAVPAVAHATLGVVQTLVAAAPAWRFSAATAVDGLSAGTAITTSRGWLTAVGGLLLLTAWTAALARPAGPLREPARRAAMLAAAGVVVVLPLAGWMPVWGSVVALFVIGSAAAPTRAWPLGAVTITVAVVLSWVSPDLSAAATGAGAAALLLARRRVVRGTEPAPAALAAAGTAAGLIAGHSALLQVGMAGRDALLVLALAAAGVLAALISSPRGLLPAGGGRAAWRADDRLAAAAPAALAVLAGPWVRGLPEGGWRAPLLTLAVLGVLAAAAVAPVRPVARRAPVLPRFGAAAFVPVAGLFAVQGVDLLGAALPTCLVLAGTVAAGGAALTLLVLLRPVLPRGRRLAAELGLLGTGLVSLGLVGQPAEPIGSDDPSGRLWLVLLLVGAAAAMIATAPDRARVRWLAGLLLTGSSWARLAASGVSVVEAYTLPPAAVLLGLSLWHLRRAAPAAGSPAPRLFAQVAALALTPSVLAAWSGSALRPVLLLCAGAVLTVLGALLWRRESTGGARTGPTLATIGALTAAATAGVRVLAGLGPVLGEAVELTAAEAWTLPAAAIVLAAGILTGWGWQAAGQPAAWWPASWPSSWLAIGPGLAMLLLPSLCLLLVNGTSHTGPVRVALIAALAGTAVFLGAVRRLQAPVLLGAGTLAVTGLVYLVPWIASIQAQLPPWVPLAIAGLALVLLGATYERRLRQVKDLRLLIAALR